MTEPATLTLAEATRQVVLGLGYTPDPEDGCLYAPHSIIHYAPDYYFADWGALIEVVHRADKDAILPPPNLAALAVVMERLGWNTKGDAGILVALVNGPYEIWANVVGWSLNMNDPDYCGADGEGAFISAGWVRWTAPGAYARLLALIAALSPEEAAP